MIDNVLWWTGAVVWVVCGACSIAIALTYAAMWTAAYVGFKMRIVGDFVKFVRSREI